MSKMSETEVFGHSVMISQYRAIIASLSLSPTNLFADNIFAPNQSLNLYTVLQYWLQKNLAN